MAHLMVYHSVIKVGINRTDIFSCPLGPGHPQLGPADWTPFTPLR